ncbi:uncharacterized protein LOC141817870 [Curcuma longa]|uniref:uncharacterized protein LOC141817870 n=1 Tax=Curcuma longa TaxID=136217 RepID=UPI003D9E4F8A
MSLKLQSTSSWMLTFVILEVDMILENIAQSPEVIQLIHVLRCAEKLVYRRQKEREHKKSSDIGTSNRKRGKDKNIDDNDIDDEYADSNSRKKGVCDKILLCC